ncbi:IspD/TarI family cytidylyltransferase [Phocaeicola sartorii]|uniref:IspD/TarI family cytidylyltransferase n=1 Tax=Phocaeicola sartorii TaxID=671267 RepID=UPI0025877801|nr:IspD/TarI family cytidylyltransferase [Phocaeicola sartorii]
MNIALLTAAGFGTRMGQDIPKQFMNIDDCPVIVYTMKVFQEHPQIDAIAVVCLDGWEMILKAYAGQYGITKLKYIFPGGDSNFQSTRNGLLGLKNSGMADSDIVIIHDGVRPLVSDEIISHNIETCEKYGYAVTGLLCKEVIMEYHDDETLTYISTPRERLCRTQTPHTYRLRIILDAQEKAIKQGLGGDKTAAMCQLVGQIGVDDQHLVLGSEKNGLKLTNVEDIELFKALRHVSKAPWLK